MRSCIYEIISLSFGLAIISFFGTLAFFPPEIMLLPDGQTFFISIIIICFAIFSALIIGSIYRDKARILVRILDFIIAIFSVFVVILYLDFSSDMMEPWMLQGPWFLRYYGVLIGIFLAVVIIKTTLALSYVSFKYHEEGTENLERPISELITLIVMSSLFSFYILEMLLYRYFLFFNALLAIFIIEIVLLIISLLYIKNESLMIEIIPFNKGEAADNRHSNRLVKFKAILEESGTDKASFYWLFFLLFGVVVSGIVILILYPFELIVTVAVPFDESIIVAETALVQVYSYLILVILLFILVLVTYVTKARKRFERYYNNKKRPHFKISILGLMDAMKVLGIFLVFSQILYFYENPIYFPLIVSLYLVFGIIGTFIFFIFGKTEKQKLILYTLSIIILISNFVLTYIDGVTYAENVYDKSYDLSFPFVYLHSFPNLILVGIPVGIIVSDLFLDLILKHTDGSDSVNRSLIPIFTIFLAAFIIMPGNWLLNNPGGDPPHDPASNLVFTLFCFILGLTLFNGLILHYIVEVLVPYLHRRKEKPKERIEKNQNKRIINHHEKPEPIQNKTIAIGLTTVVLLSVLGGLAIFYTFQEDYKRPIVAYSPGDYYIWVQNSSERVARNWNINPETSPKIKFIELSLAKNEYGAFQLVWRPLRSYIHSLSYEISDFIHTEDKNSKIYSENCSLRYEEYLLDGEFPDVLVPFETKNLHNLENYIFWFSIKTPYTLESGEYRGSIEFTFNIDEKITIDLRIKVWNFTIPRTRHLSTNIGGYSDDYALMDNYFYHRANDYGVGFSYTKDYDTFLENETTCYLNDSNNYWVFNWTYWDNMVQYKLDKGMNAFSLPYPLGIHEARVPISAISKIKLARYKNWLSEVQAHLITKKWLNYSFIYFIDEFQLFIPEGYTAKEYFVDLKEMLKEMKEAAPKIKIMATAPPTEDLEDLYNYIDIWCPVSFDRDKKRWDAELQEGKEMWMYACVGPTAPYPNSHLFNRLYECRILLWQVWLYELHGFLYWSSRGYYHGKNGYAYNAYGDGWFIWNREGEYLDTLRWEEYLLGFQDYEYLWLLDAALDYCQKNQDTISPRKYNIYRDKMDELIEAIVGERWIYTDHPALLYKAHQEIGEILDYLSKAVDLYALGEEEWVPPYYPGS
ncbi:MAG: glycoside hydrolase domain-containing protein [Promethearchaeota archaeon]